MMRLFWWTDILDMERCLGQKVKVHVGIFQISLLYTLEFCLNILIVSNIGLEMYVALVDRY
jgi:hypothetical protein